MFWIVAALLCLTTIALLVRPLLSRQGDGPSSQSYDLQVYRDQLAEVDRDLARGVLSPEEGERTRLEVSRRILAADSAAQTMVASEAPVMANRIAAALVAALILGGSAWTYLQVGAPNAPDQPLAQRLAQMKAAREQRPSQLEAEASMPAAEALSISQDYLTLVLQLREAVQTRPDDLEGHRLLARHEFALGELAKARIAQQRVLILLGDEATGSDFTDLAALMVSAAGGYVSPEAEAVLGIALQANPRDPRARYYSGLDLAQNGRPDVAYRMWLALLEEGPADAPWMAPILEDIGAVAAMAGITAELAGPSSEDVNAAAGMSEEDRAVMIRGMVEQLSERLASEGGSAAEWARLIRALGVLGETARASAIWNEARGVFADDAGALAGLLQAARDAEVAN